MRGNISRLLLAVIVLLVLAALASSKQPPLAETPTQKYGALITAVRPGGPAEAAGLEVGDVIVSVNGVPILSERDLESVLRYSSMVTVEVLRRDGGRRDHVMAFPENGELGMAVEIVAMQVHPLLLLKPRRI